MGDIHGLFEKYANINYGSITSDQKDELYNTLSCVRKDEIVTLEDHQMFLDILNKLRTVNAKDMMYYGKNFRETIKSILSVGEDGVYSNRDRFLYELIQNVDDCDYEDIENCNLDIKFDYGTDTGRIILTYNEKGFTPENVFGITGIGEKIKNISADKVEIGEKGIGFKSVFGIAEKVIIESGLFSFELLRDNFTVPMPKYDNYKPVSGTRMTLEMSPEDAEKTFRRILEQHKDKTSVIRQNPILFLNKLTHLRLFDNNDNYIVFDVTRSNPEKKGDLLVEDNVLISADLSDSNGKSENTYNTIIQCTRYTMPVVYGKEECISRYGKDSDFTTRNHNLIMIIPEINEELNGLNKGLMYSFLPTRIKINSPIFIHVPFKLDIAREFVDPQGNNQWFKYTINKLKVFLKSVFIDAAQNMKQDIIRYIPNRHKYFFDRDNNPKVDCLCLQGLQGDDICKEKVFYTEDGSMESANNVIAFPEDMKIENPGEVYRYLNLQKKLFIPNYAVDMKWYNCEVLSDVIKKLFIAGLNNENIFEKILNMLEKLDNEIDYFSILKGLYDYTLTEEQLIVISKNAKIKEAFEKIYRVCINRKILPTFIIDSKLKNLDKKTHSKLLDLIKDVDLDEVFLKYLKAIENKIYVIDDVLKDFVLAGKNGIVISKERALSSFALLSNNYDPNNIFIATLIIRQASDQLDSVHDDISNDEYLKLLRDVRKSLKNAFGQRTYDSYLQLIKKAGADKRRFLNELLQNADDCKYSMNDVPSFSLKQRYNTVEISYNELGFTKDNVRAITAIGESTKKLLLNGEDSSIGEKGVGFKSVFGVAKEVEIHSNGFDFKLNEKTPTVPDKCEHIDTNGTLMRFAMKENIKDAFSDERIIQLCICLRNLKQIEINGKILTITDKDNKRVISFGGKRYHFEKITYEFKVDDKEALNERAENKKVFSPKQYIYCYIPKDYSSNSMKLYAGLPTETICNVPLIIDAPFELTTSRDGVLQNKWNDVIRQNMYEAIINVMHEKKDELKIDVLKFVAFNNQNGVITFPMFSDKYLNGFDWTHRLAGEEIFPIAFDDDYVATDDYDCIIIPDVIAAIGPEVDDDIDEIIIDTFHKSQYIPLLEYLGAEKSNILDDLDCISNYMDRIENEEFRKALYNYLYISLNQQKLGSQRVYEIIKSMEMFPIKTRKGTEYISFNKNIYFSSNKYSDSEFYVLDTQIMPVERVYLYTHEHVNELTSLVYDAEYQRRLIELIQSDKSDEEIANYLLREFITNRQAIDKCQMTLRGMVNNIPMRVGNGKYGRGNMFINDKGVELKGTVISFMYVDKRFEEFAEYLGCDSLFDIHYDDIDYDVEELSDQDIEEFMEYFTYYSEIIMGYINDNIITDEQVEKFHLEYFNHVISEDRISYDEEFPGHVAKNIKRIKKHIKDQFINSPNPYVEKERIVREPKYKVNKDTYTLSEYGSRDNPGLCFCQMCQDLFDRRYIERNDVQKKPKFAWEQMYLSLCLTCSKDYILLRNNKTIWERFIDDIKNADIEGEENVEIEIGGDKTMTFTGTHIAEIQAIFDILGKDIYEIIEDEEDE